MLLRPATVTVTMTRHEPTSRLSSVTSSSTDSARSGATLKPLPSTPAATTSSSRSGSSSNRHAGSSKRGTPMRLKTDENGTQGRQVLGLHFLLLPVRSSQLSSIVCLSQVLAQTQLFYFPFPFTAPSGLRMTEPRVPAPWGPLPQKASLAFLCVSPKLRTKTDRCCICAIPTAALAPPENKNGLSRPRHHPLHVSHCPLRLPTPA